MTLEDAGPLADGVTPSSGELRMPFEPTRIDTAVIAIRNEVIAEHLQAQHH